MKKIKLSKQQKILLLLLELSGEMKKNLKFEDIAVALFRKFPNDFHLKGYQKYPDSGDSIKRPLYTFRDNGILIARNMVFSLTDKGLEISKKVKKYIIGKSIQTEENFDRYIEKEIKRISSLNSLNFFLQKKFDEILDIDFFDYLGVSVKTERMNFKARLNIIKEVAKILRDQKDDRFKILYEFHDFMFRKFKKEINFKLKD